ncbi:archaeal flagella assembly protein J [Caldisphaera lagunensis DSM 15908]|uniref:Archaeal flagella assembly protein J n=1 Tax=Caldisphaera lagunensis (strain DSM 15908 / JCM 11604 / ANMR 0165 / IC-154) TaxID=1056495 RepID=L0A9S1_CALLD|nr:flagella assembly protein J [Caldisphaera lagunensis]AFZ70638.1 archaeal flagella assembly protein J [Caldisphaera lagunensis DSM 15908]
MSKILKNIRGIKLSPFNIISIALMFFGLIIIIIFGRRFLIYGFSIMGIGMLLFLANYLRNRTYIKIDFDFLYALLHMYSVSTGSQPPGVILRVTGDGPHGRYSKVFKKAGELSKKWGYTVPESVNLISLKEKNKAFKEFLERFAVVSSVGEEITQFLKVEFETLRFNFENMYNRSLESLNVYYGVYTSTMVSVIFAISTMLMLSFFFGGSSLKMIILGYIAAMFIIVILGALVIIKAPKDYFEAKASRNPTARFSDILALIGVVVGSIMSYYIITDAVNYVTIGLSLIIIGLLLIPSGYIINDMENIINDYDTFFPVMIRSLGNYLSQVPNLKQAIKEMAKVELGKLKGLLKKLHSTISLGVENDIAMQKFGLDTNSETIYRGLKIFSDSEKYGGNLMDVGVAISDFDNMILSLRQRKLQVFGNFFSALVIMHASIIAILEFMALITYYFNSLLVPLSSGLSSTFPGFISPQPGMIVLLNIGAIAFSVILAVINAYILAITKVGSVRSFYLFLSVMFILTGITLVGVDAITMYMFHLFPAYSTPTI